MVARSSTATTPTMYGSGFTTKPVRQIRGISDLMAREHGSCVSSRTASIRRADSNAERDYKIAAKQRLDETAPLEQAVDASGLGEAVLAVFRATNLLSPFEKVRLQDVLRGPNGRRIHSRRCPLHVGRTKTCALGHGTCAEAA